jgi:hypothetical protein
MSRLSSDVEEIPLRTPCRISTPLIIHKLADNFSLARIYHDCANFGTGFRSPPALIGFVRWRNQFNLRANAGLSVGAAAPAAPSCG